MPLIDWPIDNKMGFAFCSSFSVEYTETSGYIAAMFDENIPEEVVIGDKKTRSSVFKTIKDKV